MKLESNNVKCSLKTIQKYEVSINIEYFGPEINYITVIKVI